MSRKRWFGSQKAWVQVLFLPVNSQTTLGKSFKFTRLFDHLCNLNNNIHLYSDIERIRYMHGLVNCEVSQTKAETTVMTLISHTHRKQEDTRSFPPANQPRLMEDKKRQCSASHSTPCDMDVSKGKGKENGKPMVTQRSSRSLLITGLKLALASLGKN